MRLPGDREWAHRHAFELPLRGRRHVGAVLLYSQLRLDAGFLELTLDELQGVDKVGAETGSPAQLGLEALGKSSVGQEPPRLFRIMAIVPGARPELIDP